MDTLTTWLQTLGLERYAQVFAESEVDLDALRLLDEQDLEKLGVPLGPRKKLLKAVAELNGAAPSAATPQGVPDQLSREQSPSAEAERRQLTVLFCDLVGSTKLATKLDPEQLRDLMQSYQRACSVVIARYDGHVAQYLGDGLMVYFGWPRAHEDDAVRAIRAGLEITEVVSHLKTTTPINARVGIHTGLVVVGETGQGDASIPKAAVGETPNIAARLQGLAAPGNVVVSERTRGLAEGLFDYSDLGTPALKGVTEPLRVFRVAGARAVESRFEAARSYSVLTPLVGREEEIALLLRRWQEAKEGEGQVVLVGGEPGIGKSRLTRALRERLDPSSYTPLRYQCSPYHVNSALYPVIEQFERAAGFTRDDTPDQKLDKLQAVLAGGEVQVAEVAPLFAAMLSLPVDRYPPLNLSPQKQKEKTLEALAGQVEALSKRQPVLAVYEDAHWVDATSQEALDLLVPRLQKLPVLLIVTYRPEYTPKWAEQAHVTVLGLSRLGRRQGAELVAKLTGRKALPAEVLDQIVAHTDGVPLFVEELTKSILESKLLRDVGDRYVLDGPLPALAIPTTLRDSLIARLDRLAPIREVAQIGACIGREFPYELLSAVSPLKGARLDFALEQLTASGLLFRRGTPPDALYTFKHALVQDAAYDSLLKSNRAQLHAQIARTLENEFCDMVVNEPELVAHHYTQAGKLDAAIPLWRRAGELALKRMALTEGIAHLSRGLELCITLPSSADRNVQEFSLRSPLLAAWPALKGWASPQTREQAECMVRLGEALFEPDALLRGLYGVFVNTITRGRVAESLDWVERLQAGAQTTNSSEFAICAECAAMTALHYSGDFVWALEHRERILTLYDPKRSERLEQVSEILGVDAKTAAGVHGSLFTWILGYADQAVKIANEAIAHARGQRQPFNLSWALTIGALVFGYRGEPDRLLEHATEAERLGREHAMWYVSEVYCPWCKGVALIRTDQTQEAIGLMRAVLARKIDIGAYLLSPFLKSAIAEGLALQKDQTGALQLIDEALEQMERPGWGERLHLAEILRLKGWVLQQQRRTEEAERVLRRSIVVAREQQAKSWELRGSMTLAQLLAERGQRRAARELLAPIYNWFTEGFDTKDWKHAKALLDELS